MKNDLPMILSALQNNDKFNYASVFLKFSSVLPACYTVSEYLIFIHPSYVIKLKDSSLKQFKWWYTGYFKASLLRNLPAIFRTWFFVKSISSLLDSLYFLKRISQKQWLRTLVLKQLIYLGLIFWLLSFLTWSSNLTSVYLKSPPSKLVTKIVPSSYD